MQKDFSCVATARSGPSKRPIDMVITRAGLGRSRSEHAVRNDLPTPALMITQILAGKIYRHVFTSPPHQNLLVSLLAICVKVFPDSGTKFRPPSMVLNQTDNGFYISFSPNFLNNSCTGRPIATRGPSWATSKARCPRSGSNTQYSVPTPDQGPRPRCGHSPRTVATLILVSRDLRPVRSGLGQKTRTGLTKQWARQNTGSYSSTSNVELCCVYAADR